VKSERTQMFEFAAASFRWFGGETIDLVPAFCAGVPEAFLFGFKRPVRCLTCSMRLRNSVFGLRKRIVGRRRRA